MTSYQAKSEQEIIQRKIMQSCKGKISLGPALLPFCILQTPLGKPKKLGQASSLPSEIVIGAPIWSSGSQTSIQQNQPFKHTHPRHDPVKERAFLKGS